eukprot:TRINITY_DN108932_c0_g1_i1.p1 TRINITY_DN108932_c0_g1~~TRINITY_DN108932_c0_g1_i1.p1  ORF type:complete len:542 (-),score=84.82 TRINITY_DN108932_c0_g1_i1:112-1668(-)
MHPNLFNLSDFFEVRVTSDGQGESSMTSTILKDGSGTTSSAAQAGPPSLRSTTSITTMTSSSAASLQCGFGQAANENQTKCKINLQDPELILAVLAGVLVPLLGIIVGCCRASSGSHSTPCKIKVLDRCCGRKCVYKCLPKHYYWCPGPPGQGKQHLQFKELQQHPSPQGFLCVICAEPFEPPEENVQRFSLEELKLATGGWKKDVIGEGAHGKVYRAKLKIRGSLIEVAVKKTGVDVEMFACFFKELDAITKLQKKSAKDFGLVHLLGVSPLGRGRTGTYCLVYEFLPGGSLYNCLHQLRKDQQHPEPRNLVRWCMEALGTLDWLHDKKIVHRDLKTANMLLTSAVYNEAKLKLTDLGFAAEVEMSETQTSSVVHSRLLGRSADSSMVGEFAICGSIGYMAPEILGCKLPHVKFHAERTAILKKSDAWSMGVVLLEALTGELAYNSDHVKPLLFERMKGAINKDEVLAPHWPQALRVCVQKAISVLLQEDADTRGTAANALDLIHRFAPPDVLLSLP